MESNALEGMTGLVCLVRHAQAKPEEEDPLRPLSDEGAREALRMAHWAAAAGLQVRQIRHSGKLRARQTAEIFGRQLGPRDGTVAAEGLGPNDDVWPVSGALEEDGDGVMVVGHLPFLGRLASLMVVREADRPIVRFRPAALVMLVRADNGWSVLCAMQPGLLGAAEAG